MSLNLFLSQKGGVFTLFLLGMIFLGMILFIERLIFLHQSQIKAASFLDGIKNLLQKRRLLEALTVCESTPGPVAQVVRVALLNQDAGEHQLRGEVQKKAILQVPILQQRLGALWIIAHLGPLVGLLGVVSAFLQCFLKMQTQGAYGAFDLFAPDVIQALASLAMGLLCAILAYIAYFFLKNRIRSLLYDIEWSAAEIVQLLLTAKDNTYVPTEDVQ